MPYISARLSCPVCEQNREKLIKIFGKSMEIIGKIENWLMCEIVDNCDIYFQGNNSKNSAMISVSLLGKASKQAYDSMTEFICQNVEEITEIPSERIYIKYQEIENWGWNNSNF